MTRPLATLLICLGVPLVWWLMWHGWRRRARSQADLPAPHRPEDLPGAGRRGEELEESFAGVYVSTTRAGDWLDRIVAHGLGTRSPVTVRVGPPGVVLDRGGSADLAIPREDLVGATAAQGIAGKVVERGGIAVITWTLGGIRVDTGLRLRHVEDTGRLIESVTALVGKVET